MTNAPDRIWAEEIGTATKGGQRFRIGRWITDETVGHPHEYLRRAPAALAADPAVVALVEAAVAAERDRCAGECDRTAREADMFGDKHGRQISERTAAAIRKETP